MMPPQKRMKSTIAEIVSECAHCLVLEPSSLFGAAAGLGGDLTSCTGCRLWWHHTAARASLVATYAHTCAVRWTRTSQAAHGTTHHAGVLAITPPVTLLLAEGVRLKGDACAVRAQCMTR
eukprot:593432-Prymnesium_polylepis.1